MGRDKARIRVEGVALLERAVRAAVRCGADVWVVGRERPEDWHGPEVPFVSDDVPGSGPAGALHTVLRQAGRDVALIACDLPSVDADAVGWLLGSERSGADAVVPSLEGRAQPLFAVYAPTCEPVLRARLEDGRRSLMGVLDEVAVRAPAVPGRLHAALRDADTPDDLPGS